MFDLRDAAGVMLELEACRKAFARRYIRLIAFDSTPRPARSVALSFIVNRPEDEPGFRLDPQRGGPPGPLRMHAYAIETRGQRYGCNRAAMPLTGGRRSRRVRKSRRR